MYLRQNIIDRMRLPFQSDRELRASLFDVLGFYPHRIHFYKLALQHKSIHNSHDRGKHGDNERLEFLGDAILDAIVGDIVYDHFRDKSEGFLTNTRSKIVQRSSLNRLASDIGLDRLINSNTNGGSHNSYMGGNAFEALVGAIYLDRGYDTVMHFMRHRILRQLIDIDNVAAKEMNFKSKLIEWCQKHRLQLEFRIMEEQRENRATPVFIARAIIEGLDCETGRGYSKKESHQRAAQATLKTLYTDKPLVERIFLAREERVNGGFDNENEDITEEDEA